MFQEPSPGPAASTWQQDVAVGGEDVENNPAPLAVAVSPQGITTVRDVPTIGAASNSVTVPSGLCKRIVGKTLQRRRITLVADAPGVTYGNPVGRINVEEGLALAHVGLLLRDGVPMPLASSGEIWFMADNAVDVEVSFWSEIDLG